MIPEESYAIVSVPAGRRCAWALQVLRDYGIPAQYRQDPATGGIIIRTTVEGQQLVQSEVLGYQAQVVAPSRASRGSWFRFPRLSFRRAVELTIALLLLACVVYLAVPMIQGEPIPQVSLPTDLTDIVDNAIAQVFPPPKGEPVVTATGFVANGALTLPGQTLSEPKKDEKNVFQQVQDTIGTLTWAVVGILILLGLVMFWYMIRLISSPFRK